MPDINAEKVCFITVKAREFECEDEGQEADASNAADDKFVSIMTEEAFSTVRAELKAYMEAMDEDEECELVARSLGLAAAIFPRRNGRMQSR